MGQARAHQLMDVPNIAASPPASSAHPSAWQTLRGRRFAGSSFHGEMPTEPMPLTDNCLCERCFPTRGLAEPRAGLKMLELIATDLERGKRKSRTDLLIAELLLRL